MVYDGSYKVDLLKDTYSQFEFDVSYRIFAGPQLARSKALIIKKSRLSEALRNTKIKL
jgi:hypothetical protein